MMLPIRHRGFLGFDDFNLLRNNSRLNVSINSPNVNISYNSGYDYNAYVQYDEFGAIIQIENVPIYYDYYETAEDIFKHFDYTINMAAYNLNTGEFSCHECFMLHNSQRVLQFNTGTRFPIISALRVQKYKERGYNISRKEFMKLLLSINKLNNGSVLQKLTNHVFKL